MQNLFQSNIDNEHMALLPLGEFPGEIIIVEHLSDLAAACNDLMAQSVIGFDTETRPSFTAGVVNRVALLQLSTPERCYLFRLCSMRLDKAIIKILEDKKIVKIGAAVRDDIKALQGLRRFKAESFVDLQTIIEQWGVKEKSVRKMSAVVLGLRVSKAQRLSNWEAVTLTRQQQLYAATDAWICAQIYDRLMITDKK